MAAATKRAKWWWWQLEHFPQSGEVRRSVHMFDTDLPWPYLKPDPDPDRDPRHPTTTGWGVLEWWMRLPRQQVKRDLAAMANGAYGSFALEPDHMPDGSYRPIGRTNVVQYRWRATRNRIPGNWTERLRGAFEETWALTPPVYKICDLDLPFPDIVGPADIWIQPEVHGVTGELIQGHPCGHLTLWYPAPSSETVRVLTPDQYNFVEVALDAYLERGTPDPRFLKPWRSKT